MGRLSHLERNWFMSNGIQAGATVKLKSGGPIMTVDKIDTDGLTNLSRAWCQWFVNQELKTGSFPVSSLELYRG
jgi:uncharacterized protein YodC (DUF2158 family)